VKVAGRADTERPLEHGFEDTRRDVRDVGRNPYDRLALCEPRQGGEQPCALPVLPQRDSGLCPEDAFDRPAASTGHDDPPGRFYEAVFDWKFTAFGPPDFYRIETPSGPNGAIQKRRELLEGKPTVGFECTIEVDDVDAIAKAITEAGGQIVMEKNSIIGVGDLTFFTDPSGNVAGAIQFDKSE
jgi:uncharacterized protein